MQFLHQSLLLENCSLLTNIDTIEELPDIFILDMAFLFPKKQKAGLAILSNAYMHAYVSSERGKKVSGDRHCINCNQKYGAGAGAGAK